MAHPSKFVSVNLNKSYGQRTNPSSSSSSSSSYASSTRARPGSHSAGGGGGMVVLSRPRSSASASAQKSGGPKLSIPPPLNLPSLRKENEKFDLSSASGPSARPGSSGIGSGSGSSSMGWTKPAPVLLQDKEAAPTSVRSGSSSYMPPAARGVGQDVPSSSPTPMVEKTVFLRGEDFPSLKATVTSGSSKQKDTSVQKEKAREEERKKLPEFYSPLRMRPQMGPSCLTAGNVADGDDSGLNRSAEQSQKQAEKLFPGPLPLVKLSHTSDWADDERDTGLALPERDRDRGFARAEFNRAHEWDADMGSISSRDMYRGDSFGRTDLIGSSKDGRDATNSWRKPMSTPARDDGVGAKTNSLSHSPYGSNASDALSNGTSDSRFARRDLGFSMNAQNGRNVTEHIRAGRHGELSTNRYRGDTFQNSAMPKSPFTHGAKGLSVNDPILNFGRDKKMNVSNSGKSYLVDSGFDDTDPFSDDPIAEVNVKVFKRKKEMQKQADFHDPVRESFEAELERVQRIQEQERQRAMEEQTRAMELARREQEERDRLVREEEERRRLIEEEAREAAWRAEQERMEAARRVEEQKVAREEEKRRIVLEEERRKEAARQKLMELEARMARRQSDINMKDDKTPGLLNEGDAPKVAADVGDWEDGERMVEHITNMPSDSMMNRYYEAGSSKFPSSRDTSSSFMEREKYTNYWKRDAYENGASSMFHPQDQENNYHSLRRDTFGPSRGFPRKDTYGSFGAALLRPSSKGGSSDHSSNADDLRYMRGNRWSVGDEGDNFSRNLDIDAAEFLDSDRFGDGAWGAGRPRGSPNAVYVERAYQNSEVDSGFTSYGRSRHSLRQPRVLPPPSVSSSRQSQSSFRGTGDHSVSTFLDNQPRYPASGRSGEAMAQSGYDIVYHQRVQQPKTPEVLERDTSSSEQKEKDSPRCDSQSSLSVSNPPTSPTQLSHDELDEDEDSCELQTSPADEHVSFDNQHMKDTDAIANAELATPDEDDDWAIENNDEMQVQEEYDEEEDGYQEEDEVSHDPVGGGSFDLRQEFDDSAVAVPNTASEASQMVLGFDEGVEVSIPMDDDAVKSALGDTVSDDRLQVNSTFAEESIDEASRAIAETEKALQELVLDSVVSSTVNPTDNTEPTTVQEAAEQPLVTSSLSLPLPSLSTVQPISSTASVDSQADAPIRLQFGLFSGPPLIPSPVPAIQIGSIQMPLHIHPQVGPSLTQMHPPPSTYFQFGQLRYPSTISQGILPIAPQAVSYVHPSTSAPYSSQNLGGSQGKQTSQESSQNSPASRIAQEQAGLLKTSVELPNNNELQNLPNNEVAKSEIGDTIQQGSGYQKVFPADRDGSSRKNNRAVISSREAQGYPGDISSQQPLGEKALSRSRAQGIIGRGKRFTYIVKNTGTRSYPGPDSLQTDPNMSQRRPRRSVRRTDFRVHENGDKRQREGLVTSDSANQDLRLNSGGRMMGTYPRYGTRKVGVHRAAESPVKSENFTSGPSSSHLASSSKVVDKSLEKEMQPKKRVSSFGNSRVEVVKGGKKLSSGDDFDAPLQSGVVRIFEQPGIEAPSDDDDFIEVRSKRQMLNDRRERREREIKAKAKAPRKHRATPQSNATSSNFKKAVAPPVGSSSHALHYDSAITGGRGSANIDVSSAFTTNLTSHTLPPIGTPPVKVDSNARSINFKSIQASSASVKSNEATQFAPGLPFDGKNTGVVNPSLSLGAWNNQDINQQVMALTQSQLDDAMKPVQFDSPVAASISLEQTKLPASVTQEKSYPSTSSPLNSLLAGEKIQFGAVTSPSILPPVSRAVSIAVGLPVSSRSDVPNDNSSATNNGTMNFDKDKHHVESCTHLEDPEAEAEAAASAVAVAAISNSDEIVGNRLVVCSVPDSKRLSAADNTGLKTSGGITSSNEVSTLSAAEESLTVALPADLSVETPTLPLWHPLPSPQSTSAATLSHFPGGQHSHFPVGFDMNPLFGGPFLAFGPHDESSGTQAQQQRSTTLGSTPIGAWPQRHPGVDPFYAPHAGFTGPYISPPGGLPGVQAPSHMVVYNHFAPVGQFGQVGLSYMGTAFIPTGKQPDWKQNPVSSSTVGGGEGDINSSNISGHCNPSMPPPLQHLAPGSPLMPMPSPLTMFEMSPFQASADMPYHARWSHLPAPPIHPVPLTMPLPPPPQQQQQQQPPLQVEGELASQFNVSLPINTPTLNERFNDPRSSTPADCNRSFPAPDEAARQIHAQIRSVEPPSPTVATIQTVRPSHTPSDASNSSKGLNGSKPTSRTAVPAMSDSTGGQNAASSVKLPVSQQQSASSTQQQYLRPTGHGEQRAGAPQKPASNSEWHRRSGYQGRGQSSDKGFTHAKVKQIYVAKQPASGSAAQS